MTMFERSFDVPPPANVAGAFALGAGMTFLADWLIRRLHPGPEPVGDDIVLQRVRARIGELVSRPDALDVSVDGGIVRITGDLPQEERDILFTQLLGLRGVVQLRSALNR